MDVGDHEIRSVQDFTNKVIDIVQDQRLYLFRGQPDDLPLLPGIARGHPTHSDLLSTESQLMDDFRRLSLPYLKVIPTSQWDWIALAQHHGIPTRLLDWTLNPLAALWFVVRRPSASEMPGVVWLLKPDSEDVAEDGIKNQLRMKRNWVFAPSNVTDRVLAQVSWFTVHRLFSNEPKCDPLEMSKEFSDKLVKMLVPVNSFADIRFQLSNMGINSFSIFPDLDGLGSFLNWREFFLADEFDKKK